MIESNLECCGHVTVIHTFETVWPTKLTPPGYVYNVLALNRTRIQVLEPIMSDQNARLAKPCHVYDPNPYFHIAFFAHITPFTS